MRCVALLLATRFAQASRHYATLGYGSRPEVAVQGRPLARSSAAVAGYPGGAAAEPAAAGLASGLRMARTPAPAMRADPRVLAPAALLALALLPGAKRQVSRRGFFLRLGAAGLAAAPAVPALARTKASMNPNKPEGVGANAGTYMSEYRKQEYAAMKGDKGSRGTASRDFDKNDTVQRNRDKYGGVARDASGKKIVVSDRTRDPAELGLKQWDGN